MDPNAEIPPWMMKHFFSEIWFILQNRSIGFSGPVIADFFSNTDFFWHAYDKTEECKQFFLIQKYIPESVKELGEIQSIEAAPDNVSQIPNDWLDIAYTCFGLHRTSRDMGMLREMARTTKVGGEVVVVISTGSRIWNQIFHTAPFIVESTGPNRPKRKWGMPEKSLLAAAEDLGLVLEKNLPGPHRLPFNNFTVPWPKPGFVTYQFRVT